MAKNALVAISRKINRVLSRGFMSNLVAAY